MNIIELEGKNIERTEDCKNALNEALGVKNWKRLYKLKAGEYDGDVRCFVNDDKQFVTVALNGEGNYCLFVDINIQEQIKAIKEIAKLYYTHDYGNIYYNPYTNSLWIVGGDGGYCYSTKPLKYDDMEDYESFEKNFKEFNTHPKTNFIKDVQWEAECEPDEEGYMLVGSINLID